MYTTPYQSQWGLGLYGYGYSYNYGDILTKYKNVLNSSAKEKKEFKNELQRLAQKVRKPIRAKMNSSYTGIHKNRKMTVSIKSADFDYFKGKEKDILEYYSKIPLNGNAIYGLGLTAKFTRETENLGKYVTEGLHLSHDQILKAVDDYFEGSMDSATFEKMFQKKIDKDGEVGTDSSGGYKGGDYVGSYRKIKNEDLYNKMKKAITSKIKPIKFEEKEESYKSGKRINPAFIKKSSWKPLVEKSVGVKKKKKVFVIIDCSGSMGSPEYIDNPSHQAISFAKALLDSGVVDVEHIILHSDGGWENVVPRFKKGEFFGYYGDSEGFEEIDMNLEREWLNDVDYIVTLTDLRIGDTAQQGLYDYLSRGKKHITLSFGCKGSLKGMNVRQVKKTEDIINALTTITNR